MRLDHVLHEHYVGQFGHLQLNPDRYDPTVQWWITLSINRAERGYWKVRRSQFCLFD
jgi:hypothetical protein